MQQITEQVVRERLKTVKDPELHLNVVDLGLIYKIEISNKNDVTVDMTVTTPGCPIIDQFLGQVHYAIHQIPEVGEIKVNLTFNPLWTPDKMNPEARAQLGL